MQGLASWLVARSIGCQLSADGLQLRTKERSVDLALVDRHARIDAKPNDRSAVKADFVRDFLGSKMYRQS